MCYCDLPKSQKDIVDDLMPFVLGLEADGGGDRNHMHVQNWLAHLALQLVIKSDKLFSYRSVAGYSYLNAIERGMSIANVGFANHATCLDPNTPEFLMDVIGNASTMKQVREIVAEYDSLVCEALKFVRQIEEH